MTEANAVRAAVAAQVIYDSATKLAAFVGNKEREKMYRATLEKAMDDCAEALGYEMVQVWGKH